jgi:hypothetical protein
LGKGLGNFKNACDEVYEKYSCTGRKVKSYFFFHPFRVVSSQRTLFSSTVVDAYDYYYDDDDDDDDDDKRLSVFLTSYYADITPY